jgi:hypothetical protein
MRQLASSRPFLQIKYPRVISSFHTSKDCIEASDGTHTPIFVRALSAPAYRNRKGPGVLTHNVLGACTFNLQFYYVYAGWEGSADDQAALNNAMGKVIFQIPLGKY